MTRLPRFIRLVCLFSLVVLPFSQEAIADNGDNPSSEVLQRILNRIEEIACDFQIPLSDKCSERKDLAEDPFLEEVNKSINDRVQVYGKGNQAETRPSTLPTIGQDATLLSLQSILVKTNRNQDIFNLVYNNGASLPSYEAVSKQSQLANAPNYNNNVMNMDVLLSPIVYAQTDRKENDNTISPGGSELPNLQQKTQQDRAKDFIKLASGSAYNIPKYDLRTYNRMKQEVNTQNPETSQEFVKYLARLETYMTWVSVGLSNFNYMFSKRVPSEALEGKSQLYTEYQMANHRMHTDWRKNLKELTPTEMQAESLQLMAEMNYQLYLNRIQNERVLAALTALQIQGLNWVREGLAEGEDQDIPSGSIGIIKP